MKKDYILLFPLFLLLAASLYLLLTVLFTNTMLMREHIIGLAFLGIVVIIHFFNRTVGYQATGLLLFVGTFSALGFTPTLFFFGIGKLKFDAFCVAVSIVYIIVHRHVLPDWIRWLVGSKSN